MLYLPPLPLLLADCVVAEALLLLFLQDAALWVGQQHEELAAVVVLKMHLLFLLLLLLLLLLLQLAVGQVLAAPAEVLQELQQLLLEAAAVPV